MLQRVILPPLLTHRRTVDEIIEHLIVAPIGADAEGATKP